MVILGLGGNLGDKLFYLRKAFLAIKAIPNINILQVSPLYYSDAMLPENASADWDHPYINLALRLETSLNEFELLAKIKNIESSIGRKPEKRHWGPREIDIDILAWDDKVISHEHLTIPHYQLHERPFALWPLSDVAPLWVFPIGPNQGKTAAEVVEMWGSRFIGEAPFHTKQIPHRIDTPEIVGVLNVTPDSFSDGGQFLNPDAALKQFHHLIESGATIIDIGAESTAPHAKAITTQEESLRLTAVLEMIASERQQSFITPKISIDTIHASVAKEALKFGADWINDQTGGDSSAMREVIANANVDCVIMHHLSIPERRNHVLPRHDDPVKTVYSWGEKRIKELELAGIARDRIIFDPGIGFGKMAEQSLLILQHANVFKELGTRLLLGHSRKSFMTLFTNLPPQERDVETLAFSIELLKHQPDYLRVHNVDWCARGFRVCATV